MTQERKWKLIWRWSLVTAGLIAVFWTVWYLINGSVPMVTSIKMTPTWTIELPFSVSRWWDVLIGPIWSTIIIIPLFTDEKNIGEDEDLVFGLVPGLAFGLIILGLPFGLAFGLPIGLVFGLVFGLVYGLPFGLAYGLAFGLAFGLPIGLVFGLATYLIKVIASKKFWQSIADWLLAR